MHSLRRFLPLASAYLLVASASGATKAPALFTVSADAPAKAQYADGVPVGLYFMTRFWPATSSLEKAAWYFAPDGSVYEKLAFGFSREDLAAHTGRRGTARLDGAKLEITWADGKKRASKLERSRGGFIWEMGNFTPVQPFANAAELAATYTGGESVSGGGANVAVSKTLELRADGSFRWDRVSFVGSTSQTTRLSAGSSGATTGTWSASAFSLTLTDSAGTVLRRIAFPYDDDKTPLKPDRIFFGGIMYKRQ